MLRSVIRAAPRVNVLRAAICRPQILTTVRTYQVATAKTVLKTSYDSVEDYSSYKHNLFTHRLPESSAEQSAPLVALHSRLNLPSTFALSTLSQCLNLLFKDDGLANNFGLNTLGKTMLSYYVTEYLLIHYPRLPMSVHNAAVDSLMGTSALYEIGKSWGITVDTTSKLDKFLGEENEFLKYGKLRYISDAEKEKVKETGVEELVDGVTEHSREAEAYASAVRAIIGGLYTHSGEDTAKKFIEDHILSRKIPLDQMFQFSKPSAELVRLCDKLGFDQPISIRLMAETGRASSHPQYLTGVFVGTEKLGEAIGSSLNESKTRAVINALLAYYLYSPINAQGDKIKVPSETNYKFEGIIGIGDVAI
ncbi:uncharacterized protein SPAPADRAFT_58379 [Spathaspora passalidarum NRRL Y-27907]|uniref:RNase III domain-containing protein n=1 Tax=Spathaspora passalidarum (strain NRRL Y-27907 / 11-Y1) TaxID=619300 RepID=G3AG47_SPAPN|nr:uncharacterized protein SPAPADRAFT_58379 [Spathaspora passalidarum NRRL Y-27907]EGW35186.1 hypothetical protein SPAPADRAFT_58379 [Spathaspora passalidarum NRRL Y-27907]